MLAYGPASGVEKPVPANYVELSRRVAGYSALIQRHIHMRSRSACLHVGHGGLLKG